MNMPSPDSEEQDVVEAATPTASSPEGGDWTLIALVGHDGQEPPINLSDSEALATWAAITALWHPALLAQTQTLPRIESLRSPTPPNYRELRVIAGVRSQVSSGYETQAEDVGALLVESGSDRQALVETLVERLGTTLDSAHANDEGMKVAAADFLALGTAYWMLRDLTTAMGHSDGLDAESLAREVLAGALAWCQGDHPSATNRLRASFELLTQARERFYPVDAYIVDLCLVDPTTPVAPVAKALEARAPVTFLAPAQAIDRIASDSPETIQAICEGVTEGWVDVVGGTYSEAEESLLPLESILWQYRRGSAVYRKHLEGRNVETFARRRFALYPDLPQLAKRFGFRFAYHMGFDAGKFPVRPEAKRLWEGLDGTTLETLTRPPLGADRNNQVAFIPWRLAISMKEDHVATLPLVHWPNPVADWYVDLRRASTYSPVLARWVTLNDYFHLTDRPFETFRPEHDDYVTPYLAQAIARRDDRPVSRKARHTRLRGEVDALSALKALDFVIQGNPPSAEAINTEGEAEEISEEATESSLETRLETGKHDELKGELESELTEASRQLARTVAGLESGGRPGYLVFNPSGIARRAHVQLPDAALDLKPEGPLRAAQFTDEGVWAVVDLPAFGYAWVPRESEPVPSATPIKNALTVKGRVLSNESLAIEIDAATGGIRSLRTPVEELARLGQQLVVNGLTGTDGAPASSKMRGESFDVEYGGPALIQAVSRGVILDAKDQKLAAFQQRFRLWSGRPNLELDIQLSELDPAWLERIAQADPWSHYLACRWAWPDTNSMLRRTCLLSPHVTEADRPETPDAFDISTRRQRSALLFGGLAHHRRHGQRMLDTILVAGRESERSFQVGAALELEHPYQAAFDFVTPAFVVSVETGPPRTGPTGWFFKLDNRSVAVTRLEPFQKRDGDMPGWGVVFHLFETAGNAVRCRLRTFRNPVWARQTDFHHELVVDLPIEDDTILIDLTPHEMARVEVTFG